MYVCILDQHGAKLVHKKLPTTPEAFLRTVAPYRDDLGVAVECMLPGTGWPPSARQKALPLS
jgi:hypothetical protein